MADFDDHTHEDAEHSFESEYEMQGKVLLGEGTYGKVYKVRSIRTGEAVAIKQMKLDAQEEGVPSTAIREVALLKELQHPNIVRLLDVHCKEPNKLVLVFEYLENDLKKYMKALKCTLSPGTVKNLAHQLCTGIEFCHANRIIHRDLKPQNLLIDQRLKLLKIADFGLARAFTVPVPKYTHEVVTVWYRPPEILLGSPIYSVPVDLWSIGCVIGDMATGAPLFAGDSEIDTCFKIFQKLGTPNEQVWPGVNELPDFKASFPKWTHRGWANIRNIVQQMGKDGVELLERLMCYDPRQRISARRALQHQYFRDVDASCFD
jgi:serine/threonine protein kinase